MRHLPLLALPWLMSLEPPKDAPNIVLVLCDDLGYGDVHCLAPETSKIPTPGADRLAREGMTFTDAHSGSSVCTPTRYGILTGRYAWRTPLQNGVVTGSAPCLIPEDRPTVASFLKDSGYDTAIFGKWHLDFQYFDADSREPLQAPGEGGPALPPVGSEIPDGPLHRGFDRFYGFHHARQMEAVVEGSRVVAHRDPIEMLPTLTKKCVEYIEAREASSRPFFLYVPLGSPHTPIVPSKEWQGRSELGPYADFVMQTDHALVEILRALEENDLAENTLVLFTSDNGCSPAAKIAALARQGHRVSAGYRGAKADIWDGGHRIPFIARWPGVIEAGATSRALICLGDLFATVADALDSNVPEGSCEDSISFLPTLEGRAEPAGRTTLVHHSISGHFGYREAEWKLLLARGSGGWSAPKEKAAQDAPPAQLYHMRKDPGETTNLYLAEPKIAARLLRQLEADVVRGRSTPGEPSPNDLQDIVLWKSGAPPVNARRPSPAEDRRDAPTPARSRRTTSPDRTRAPRAAGTRSDSPGGPFGTSRSSARPASPRALRSPR